jgi:hypothetical protein
MPYGYPIPVSRTNTITILNVHRTKKRQAAIPKHANPTRVGRPVDARKHSEKTGFRSVDWFRLAGYYDATRHESHDREKQITPEEY